MPDLTEGDSVDDAFHGEGVESVTLTSEPFHGLQVMINMS